MSRGQGSLHTQGRDARPQPRLRGLQSLKDLLSPVTESRPTPLYVTSWCSPRPFSLAPRASVTVSVTGQSLRVHSGEEAEAQKDSVWPPQEGPGSWLKCRFLIPAPGEGAPGVRQEPVFSEPLKGQFRSPRGAGN